MFGQLASLTQVLILEQTDDGAVERNLGWSWEWPQDTLMADLGSEPRSDWMIDSVLQADCFKAPVHPTSLVARFHLPRRLRPKK